MKSLLTITIIASLLSACAPGSSSSPAPAPSPTPSTECVEGNWVRIEGETGDFYDYFKINSKCEFVAETCETQGTLRVTKQHESCPAGQTACGKIYVKSTAGIDDPLCLSPNMDAEFDYYYSTTAFYFGNLDGKMNKFYRYK